MFGLALTSAQLNGSGLEGVGEARIEMSKNFGDISEKYLLSAGSDTIFVTDYRPTEISVIFENIADISVFVGILPIFREISRYFLPVQPTHGYKICPTFFKKKHKMLSGNLIMICRQRLCFSAWLKNRGFRVREI